MGSRLRVKVELPGATGKGDTARCRLKEPVVVDVDLDSFFDRVNHDALMARIARKVGDKRILTLAPAPR